MRGARGACSAWGAVWSCPEPASTPGACETDCAGKRGALGTQRGPRLDPKAKRKPARSRRPVAEPVVGPVSEAFRGPQLRGLERQAARQLSVKKREGFPLCHARADSSLAWKTVLHQL